MSNMINNRRRFLFGAAALLAAPAIARASSLMPVSMLNPILWGDGVHDDAPALQRIIDRGIRNGFVSLPHEGMYRISRPLIMRTNGPVNVYARHAPILLDASVPVAFDIKPTSDSARVNFYGLYIDARSRLLSPSTPLATPPEIFRESVSLS